MKRIITLVSIFLCPFLLMGQDAYRIRITFKPYRNQYIYLGHYFGKSYPVIDSVRLDETGTGVFKGTKKLNGGIYLIGYQDRTRYFEVLIDTQQTFAMVVDTLQQAEKIRFIGSPDNELFQSYQKEVDGRGRTINALKQQLTTATAADSARLIAAITTADRDIRDYRERFIREHPGTLLAALLTAMREPELPAALQRPANGPDSLAAYQLFKSRFWEGVGFWDGRLAYTTFFEEKLDKYFNQLVIPHPDSVIREIDHMMAFATASKEMTRFLLIKFINRYINQKYMWEDAVFVHLFEKYLNGKEYDWLNEKGRKLVTDRAYSLMANIMGTPASDVVLPDSSGTLTGLYDLQADYTLLVFWDPTCGHCREVLPRVDSFYRAAWKAAGLKLFAVAKETEGTRSDWTRFIREEQIEHWTHVYCSKADDKARIESGIPGYSQLFDIQSFPVLYLLDREKRIMAKKLAVEQVGQVLDIKRQQ